MPKRKQNADILKPAKPKRTYKKKVKPAPLAESNQPVGISLDSIVIGELPPAEEPVVELPPAVEEEAPVKLNWFQRLYNWLFN